MNVCGIAGYLRRAPAEAPLHPLEALLGSIQMRGPDGEGLCLISREKGEVRSYHTERSSTRIRATLPHFRDAESWIPHDLALLHTRYSVIAPGDEAHQPFHTGESNIIVAFQGEIFNYLELREELRELGLRFRTSSDTEVLAHAYGAWGDEAWAKLNGFWAVALYDRLRRRFVLCRDRLGIAPLYVARIESGILFGTSALGLAAATPGGVRPRPGRVADFVETGLRDFDGRTFFHDVRPLKPGSFVAFDAALDTLDSAYERKFWELPRARLTSNDLSLPEAATQFREVLTSAVSYRLRADLSVAFQLSGGLDSTTVVALASELGGGPLPTYTVSVPESDEEPLAATMERRFRLDRTVLRSLGNGLQEDALTFARMMEEPVQAPSAYANHVMCRIMKNDGFGVILSGSGGDEALAGYEWDFWPAAREVMRAEGHPWAARWHQLGMRYGSPRRVAGSVADRVGWVGRVLGRPFGIQTRRGAPAPARPALAGPADSRGTASKLLAGYALLDYDARRRFHLEVAHLPYYLASNDRATLGIPVEHRQPFLDHRVVELGLVMPPSYLFRGGWTKYVLRRAMSGLLPPEILWRREKLGFPFPVVDVIDAHRPLMERAVKETFARGYMETEPDRFDDLLTEEPLRLWRLCSVGMWLDAIA